MNEETPAIYEQQAQLQKEKKDLEAQRELLFTLLASVTNNEVTANAEGATQ